MPDASGNLGMKYRNPFWRAPDKEAEYDQIMAPLTETLTLLREAARELLKRTAMVPYLSAETDCRGEAEYILNAIDGAERGMKRYVKDAVEV